MSLLVQIWATGDVGHADDIMASNVKLHSLIEGNSLSGVDTFKSMVSNIFKACPITSWHCKELECSYCSHAKFDLVKEPG